MALTMTGQASQAAGRAGAASAYKHILDDLLAKKPPPAFSTEDTTWTDPAARRSKKEPVNV